MRRPPDVTDHRARVLIVDDERHNRQLLEVMLAPEGLELCTATSGEKALAMVAAQKPDLILLDIMMPGQDGYRVARKLKADPATRSIPIIMITALDNRDARMMGLGAGADDFLTKPVDRAELCVRVRNLLRLKAYGDDNYSAMLEDEVVSRTTELLERTRAIEQQGTVLSEQAALLHLTQDAILVRDMAGHVMFWSRGAEALYGWSSAEALGKNATDLLRIEFSASLLNVEGILLQQGRWEGEEVHHRRDGTRLIVASRWALQRDPAGVPTRILTLTNDITGRKLADSERVLLTERLSLATAVAKVGVWEWDLAFDALTWDATMFEIYGLPPVVPMPYTAWSAAVHAEDRTAAEAELQLAIAARGEGRGEYRIVKPDGSLRTISAVQRAILDDAGNVRRLIGVNMDITERKEAERSLERSRRDQLRFKDEFLSHVSHELRSPLTAIKQFSSILLGGLAGELNPEQRQYQEIVLKNIGQLQSMIDDLLEVTRLETGKLSVEPERLLLADAVRDGIETLQGAAAAKGVRMSTSIAPGLPLASADPTRVRQILIILLDNAVKFTGAGGSVTVDARPAEEDPGFLLVSVRDTGCGIDPAIAKRLFERLYQASEPADGGRQGLGLGLFICRELVSRQGGRIWAHRGDETGTVFSFTLPVFSLASVIAPLVRDETWPLPTVGLVKVELRFPHRSAGTGSGDDWSQEARSLVGRCLLPDLDVLLPGVERTQTGESHSIAAFASEQGVGVLVDRIRSQFARHKHFGLFAEAVRVSHVMLDLAPREAGQSVGQMIATLAGQLEASIDHGVSLQEVAS